MNIEDLSSANLKSLLTLIERKEALLAQVAKIDAELAGFGSAKAKPTVKSVPPAAKVAPAVAAKPAAPAAKATLTAATPKAAKRAKRQPRGQLKAAVVALLKGAGKEGLAVKDIATKVGLDYKRIFSWFYSTGKSVKQIKKVGEAKYAWVG